ncbi:MAG: HEAT repeat domain-containing protein [Candidatus Thiodiazotropha sp. (ex Rostrolucina anterorostrata)]|nr:HEAT repeat domain-containing protein [Candidatus Thiodiazotropha sp. (ex Rostrolucina anterorostrata)]
MKTTMFYPDPSTHSKLRLQSVHPLFLTMGTIVFLTVPAQVAAVESVASRDSDGLATALAAALLVAIALGALLIIGLVHWGRKQEHIGEMMLFCMKYLLGSEDEAERCASARALGESKDAGALLVLVDVISDEEEIEAVRKAASEALHEMRTRFRKYRDVIADLELEAEQRNFLGIINILADNFEQDKMRYAQSAYIIGRHYMRLGNYVDAREWLTKAEFRNRKSNLYGNRIKYWIKKCNTRLLEEADTSFKSADYHQAKEHYAVLDHGLIEAEKKICAVYLRSSCIYCMLKDYRNADQSLLQALEHGHATDLALTLVPLLQEAQKMSDKKLGQGHNLEGVARKIDERVSAIMNVLMEQDF